MPTASGTNSDPQPPPGATPRPGPIRALGGDRVSEEYLKADLYRRAEALRDMPDAPLFFGRLDYAQQAGGAGEGVAGHRFHVGRRHIHDPDGHPVVIDWRAPVSRPFFPARP